MYIVCYDRAEMEVLYDINEAVNLAYKVDGFIVNQNGEIIEF